MAKRLVSNSSVLSEQYPCKRRSLSSAEQLFNEITFTCNICNQSVKSAMFLNCLHTFCAECVDKKLKAGKEDTESPPAEKCIGHPHLTCPLCPDYDNLSVKLYSNPLPQLITSLKAIRYKLQLGGSLKCTDCLSGNKGKQAVAYCIECDTAICQIDLKGHQKYSIANHNIIAFDRIQNLPPMEILQFLKTSQHSRSSESLNTNVIESVQIAKGKIDQLNAKKLELEIAWDNQFTHVTSLYEYLKKQLDESRTNTLAALSASYQGLISQLDERIKQLEQTISYTEYVRTLSNFNHLTSFDEKNYKQLENASNILKYLKIPEYLYSIAIKIKDNTDISYWFNNYICINKCYENFSHSEVKLSLRSDYSKTGISDKILSPIDLTFDYITGICYVLYESYIQTFYESDANSLAHRSTINLIGHKAKALYSCIAINTDDIILLIDNQFYAYSKVDVKQYIETGWKCFLHHPKIYSFPNFPHRIYLFNTCTLSIYLIINATIGISSSLDLNTSIRNFYFLDLSANLTKNQIIVLGYAKVESEADAPKLIKYTTYIYYIRIFTCDLKEIKKVKLDLNLSPFSCLLLTAEKLCILDIERNNCIAFDFTRLVTGIYEKQSPFLSNDLQIKFPKYHPVKTFLINKQKILLLSGGNVQIADLQIFNQINY